MNVRIRRLHSDAPLPRYESGSAAAFDFSATEDVTINPSQVALVPTGLVIEVPEGMFLGIFARSSTPMRRGLMVANGVGVVDPDYCGPEDEVKVAVMNFTAVSAETWSLNRTWNPTAPPSGTCSSSATRRATALGVYYMGTSLGSIVGFSVAGAVATAYGCVDVAPNACCTGRSDPRVMTRT